MNWKLEKRKLTDLKPFKKNPRILTKKGMADLKDSIDKFGLAEPIVIQPSGDIIGGHGRYVLKQNKAQEVDVYVPDRTLNEKEYKKDKNIACNWDFIHIFALWFCKKIKYGFVDFVKKNLLYLKHIKGAFLNIVLNDVTVILYNK